MLPYKKKCMLHAQKNNIKPFVNEKNTRVKLHTWIHNLYVYTNISMVERTFRISKIFFIKCNKIHISNRVFFSQKNDIHKISL